ncbi:hypothetical protein [Opitutus terrae]|uniref:Uncharacterized protein n=1 Tax=Opitutus terrae (strain DSM 11246 / JCM 15787 / PB90-1) TaxID=452637 RepID=B2A060_OPITP|nr:hypothetical protein [Opitutus terrae]ACB77396.1 hypothetical protein Oter_4122 [Opitutus terrae PB90-1]
MSLHRPRTKQAIRHTDQTTIEHGKDKEQGEARQTKAYLRYDVAPSPSPVRDLSALAPWALRREPDGRFVQCTLEGEYGDFAESQAKARNWYYGPVRRKAGDGRVRRKCDSPLEYLVITAAPWLSQRVHDMLRVGDDPRPHLRRIFARWMTTVGGMVSHQRHWIGASCHTDTSDLHVDLLFSRYDGKGGKIGKPGLQLAGPWMVGVDRQLQAGASIASYKRRQFRSNLSRHQQRYGDDAVPLDLALSRGLDECAQLEMPELAKYRADYARRVPELEHAHLKQRAENARRTAERLESLASAAEPDAEISWDG